MPMDLTNHFKDIIMEAVEDWSSANPNFVCGIKIRSIGVEGNDLFIDGRIAFAPSNVFIRDSNVWQYDGFFIIGNAHLHSDSDSEAYLGMMDCLHELFIVPPPALCA